MADTDYQGRPIDFSQPLGEAAMLPPDSVQWRIYKNQIALGIGGVAAVLLEFADPRIRSGVWDHSTYKADPIGRSRRTGTVAMIGCYGPASLARSVIQDVNRLHARVKGETPSGERYKALDPELLDWVAATASYGFLNAYHRFVSPLSPADHDRFYRDSAAVGSLFGARNTPGSQADFMAMMAALEHRFEPHPIIHEFLAIIQSGTAAPSVPRFLHRALARAAVSLLPGHIRQRLDLGKEFDLRTRDRLALRLVGRLADRRVEADAPHCQACVRLGLPHDFLYRPADEQRKMLALAA